MAKYIFLAFIFISIFPDEIKHVDGFKRDWLGRIIPKKIEKQPCKINGLVGNQPDDACLIIYLLNKIANKENYKRRPVNVLIQGQKKSGKTFLVKKIAEETHSHLILLDGAHLKSYDEITVAYEEAGKLAIENKTVIVCIDNINEIAIRDDFDREKALILAEMRVQMDKYKDNPKIATIALSENRTYLEYCSLKRFNYDFRIKQNLESRKLIIKHFLEMYNKSLSEQDIVLIAKQTKGFSFNHIELLMRRYIVHCIWKGIELNANTLIYKAQIMRDIDEIDDY